VKASNALFDAERRIQIADLSSIRLQTGAAEPFAGEGWSPVADVCAFAPLIFEIAVGRPDAQPGAAPPISEFVSVIIKGGWSPSPTAKRSFADILQSLLANGFAILAGVDSVEVCAFVESVESSEQGVKREQTRPRRPLRKKGMSFETRQTCIGLNRSPGPMAFSTVESRDGLTEQGKTFGRMGGYPFNLPIIPLKQKWHNGTAKQEDN
jgi:hypothetical protein